MYKLFHNKVCTCSFQQVTKDENPFSLIKKFINHLSNYLIDFTCNMELYSLSNPQWLWHTFRIVLSYYIKRSRPDRHTSCVELLIAALSAAVAEFCSRQRRWLYRSSTIPFQGNSWLLPDYHVIDKQKFLVTDVNDTWMVARCVPLPICKYFIIKRDVFMNKMYVLIRQYVHHDYLSLFYIFSNLLNNVTNLKRPKMIFFKII